MLRLIILDAYMGHAANVDGAPVQKTYLTFDVDIPEVEKALRLPATDSYYVRQLVGVEILEK